MGRTALGVIVLGFFIYVVSPFLVSILMAGVFAILFFPLHQKMVRRKIPKTVSGAAVTLAVTVLLLVPASIMIYWLATQGVQKVGSMEVLKATAGEPAAESVAERILTSPVLTNGIERLSQWVPLDPDDMWSAIKDVLKRVGTGLGGVLGGFLANLPSMLTAFAVCVMSLFFFLVDGERIRAWIKQNTVLKPRETEKLLNKLSSMCRGVILASVISALVQATLFWIAGLVVGVGSIGMVFLLVFFSAFIPLVGTAPVTLSVAVYQAILGNIGDAVFLGIVALFVTTIDNFIRPAVMKGASDLHPLLAFVGAFGGLATLGITGIFLGPILAGVVVVTSEFVLNPDARNS